MKDIERFSPYLDAILDSKKIKTTINNLILMLKKIDRKSPFSTIVVRGLSGIVPASIISYLLDKKICIVRHDLTAHAQYMVEGCVPMTRFVIIDELISSGATISEIFNNLNETGHRLDFHERCLGVILYANRYYTDYFDFKFGKNIFKIPVYCTKDNEEVFKAKLKKNY